MAYVLMHHMLPTSQLPELYPSPMVSEVTETAEKQKKGSMKDKLYCILC